MPSAVAPRRRRYDDDDSSNNARDPEWDTATSSKKARLNINGDASPSQRNPMLPNGYGLHSNRMQPETLQSKGSRRTHRPGSIVRVRLANFVTYTAVEFLPGPSLNMVIGPNGTGKSTLVCAICLGLGWGPQHLGRAKEVSEFVKHGEQEAMIEIELAGNPQKHSKNPMIKCNIKREGNRTNYSLDGKPSNKKAVVDLCRSFSIQIDNLCQFLPQDKVVEFAAMTPVELLRSTQRAVAPQEMLDWHEKLKDFRRKQKELEGRHQADQDALENLEGRQRMQADDVQRMRERDDIKEKVKMLELARPLPKYRDARRKHGEAKDKRKKATEELKAAEDEVEPSLRAVNEKQAYQRQVELAVNERKKAIQTAERDADNIDRRLKDLHERKGELNAEADAEKEGGRKSREEIARLKGNITRLKKQIEEQPPDLDVSGFNERVREKQRSVDDSSKQITDLKQKQQDIGSRGREKADRIQNAKKGIANLESQAGQQEHKLKSVSSDTAKAWEWIKEHQDEFEKPVFGPPIIECSITDMRYIDQIETLFQRGQMLTLTVQTNNDFKKLGNILHDQLRLSEINMQHMAGTLKDFPAPVSKEELPRFGLVGWALDYITGPEPVMAMLCANVRLHQTGVGVRDTSTEAYDLLLNSPIENWVTTKSSYKFIRRREYGPSAVSTNVRDTKKAQVWTTRPVDIGAKRQLQENISEWNEEIDGMKREVEEAQTEIGRLRDDIREKQEEIRRLQTEKAARQKALAEIRALPTKLAQQEEKLAAEQENIAALRQRLQAISDKVDAVTRDRVRAALDYAQAVQTLQAHHASLHEAELMLLEAKSDLETLTAKSASVTDLLAAKRAEIEGYARETSALLDQAKKILAVCNRILQNEPNHVREFLQSLPQEQTSEELESEIESEKARLELLAEGSDRGVIREFEAREKRIEGLKAKVEEYKEELRDLAGGIEEVRGKWEPQLDRLIGKISAAFGENMKGIGCAGEVGVAKEEDFEAWSVKILVKFRESEPLTPLDSHRQSGGERAVSTIFYLMSLQSLTRSPFRVVDEINQGMDPRNERMVHKRMVSVACGGVPSLSSNANSFDPTSTRTVGIEGETGHNGTGGDEEEGAEGEGAGGSQYFLITPKLLPDLTYERGMQVLCIASGEYMPERPARVDFRSCVDIGRAIAVR
ncbi:MAG: hypothetical protein Q9167_007835 [Letrouitia subvulpina]